VSVANDDEFSPVVKALAYQSRGQGNGLSPLVKELDTV